jgi:hypothetical protein
MLKAEYRRTDRCDARSPATPIGDGDHAAAIKGLPTSARPETADDLRAEIVRLYGQLATWTGGRPTLRYVALETQIRALADRYRAFEDWTAVSPPLPKGGDTRPRRFFRTASEPRPRLTRVW